MQGLKSGWKTSEFWFAVAAHVIALLIVVGVVTAEQGSVLEAKADTIILAVLGLIGLVDGSYSVGRGMAKKA